MMIGIGEQCLNRWNGILPLVGIETKYLTGKQTPCPICGGKDRFRFDNKDGRGTFYCNNCGAGDGVQLVMMAKQLTFRGAAELLREFAPGAHEVRPKPSLSEEARINALRDTWRMSRKITAEDDAGRYLVSRGFSAPFSPALRFVPKLKVTGEKVDFFAAMVALVRKPDGTPHTLHRTYLKDGAKADIASPRRMMPGDTPRGSYIALSDPAAEMGAAEGIETALAVERDFGIPCWSLISSDGLREFLPPIEVTRLRIFGDNDPKFGGQAAAYALAHRLACKFSHIEASVEIPPFVGTDWADRLDTKAA